MTNKIFVANWKMNPSTIGEAIELFNLYIQEAVKNPNTTIVVCPPFLYIEELSKLLNVNKPNNLYLGAQDLFWEESGAFTGEISTKQLSEFGVKYVLVGHSERRALGETDEMINKKLLSALRSNIIPVLLVGESEKGEHREDILIDQLANDLKDVGDDSLGKFLVTYEPVWAISSHSGGQSDTPESSVEAINSIKNILQKRFPSFPQESPMLYGGSVNASNIQGFLSKPEILGAVVGSAGIKKEEIPVMLGIANSLSS